LATTGWLGNKQMVKKHAQQMLLSKIVNQQLSLSLPAAKKPRSEAELIWKKSKTQNRTTTLEEPVCWFPQPLIRSPSRALKAKKATKRDPNATTMVKEPNANKILIVRNVIKTQPNATLKTRIKDLTSLVKASPRQTVTKILKL